MSRGPRRVAAALALSSAVLQLAAGARADAPKPAPAADAAKDQQVQALREKARAAAAKEKWDEAVPALEEALKLDHKADIVRELADVLSWAGRIDESVARYEELRKLVPGDDSVLLSIGRALSWSKKKEHLARAVKVLDDYLAAHPTDDEDLLQRARARTWSGDQPGGAKDFRDWLSRHPEDDKVRLELASNLSASTSKADLAESGKLYDAWLAKHPDDTAVKLQRAKVRAWAGDVKKAAAELRAYLVEKPGDDDARLQLATVLSWSKDETDLKEAIGLFDAWLAKHPEDDETLLQRARAKNWARMTKQSEADFRAYLAKHPADDKVWLELGSALSQGSSPGDAVPIFDRYLERHPDDLAVRTQRARVLLWGGDYDAAETALLALREAVKSDPARAEIELELARCYAQTTRQLKAIAVLDLILSRAPAEGAEGAGGGTEASGPNVWIEARAELRRLRPYHRPRLEAKFLYYADKGDIRVAAGTLEAIVPFTRQLAAIADVGEWRLENVREVLWSTRLNGGLRFACACGIEAEAAAGPRFYQYFPARLGARAAAKYPVAPWARVGANWQYDDVYFDLYQPATVSAGIRGQALFGTVELQLPFHVTASGHFGRRWLLPDNRSLEANGSVMIALVGPLAIGYSGQWLRWDYNDPAYWSPQGYVSHQLAVRVSQDISKIGFAYELQALIGAAGERILGVPESGYGVAFGGSGGLLWAPVEFVQLRLGAQYGETRREVLQVVAGGTSAGTPQTVSVSSTYWWFASTFSATVAF